MFHGAMAFRADQRELHSSCSAPHSAFCLGAPYGIASVGCWTGIVFPTCFHFSRCVVHIHGRFSHPFFQMCAQDHEWFPSSREGKRFTRSGCASENFEVRALRSQNFNYRTFPSGICKRTFPSKGWWGWESVCWLLIGCLLYTSPSPRDLSTSRMPSSA